MTAPASSTSTDRIPFARTPMSEEAPAAVARVLSSGWVTTGPEVAAFEQEFAAWMGADARGGGVLLHGRAGAVAAGAAAARRARPC